MSSDPDRPAYSELPTKYVCPSCHLHLLSWTRRTNSVEMFHKVVPWSDFWTGDVRLVCQYCFGTTDVLPPALVTLLRERYGLQVPGQPPTPPGRRD